MAWIEPLSIIFFGVCAYQLSWFGCTAANCRSADATELVRLHTAANCRSADASASITTPIDGDAVTDMSIPWCSSA